MHQIEQPLNLEWAPSDYDTISKHFCLYIKTFNTVTETIKLMFTKISNW